MKKLRVGTRKSLLSARQTEMALAALAKAHPVPGCIIGKCQDILIT